jgi:hypothetical protein
MAAMLATAVVYFGQSLGPTKLSVPFELQSVHLQTAFGIVVLRCDISQTAGSIHPNCISNWRLSPRIHKLITFLGANILADFFK